MHWTLMSSCYTQCVSRSKHSNCTAWSKGDSFPNYASNPKFNSRYRDGTDGDKFWYGEWRGALAAAMPVQKEPGWKTDGKKLLRPTAEHSAAFAAPTHGAAAMEAICSSAASFNTLRYHSNYSSTNVAFKSYNQTDNTRVCPLFWLFHYHFVPIRSLPIATYFLLPSCLLFTFSWHLTFTNLPYPYSQ